MVGRSRYSVSEKASGVEGGVLKNKLNIKDQKSLDDAETLLLSDAYSYFFNQIEQEGLEFSLSFLFEIHQYFLGPLYTWAGKVRRINISKDDVLFASAEYLEQALKEFEDLFKKGIPMKKDSKAAIVRKLAFIHNELNVLHPFREGNGRTIRLFLDLMAAQVGYNLIEWDEVSHEKYIEACKLGMLSEHVAMEKIIGKGLRK